MDLRVSVLDTRRQPQRDRCALYRVMNQRTDTMNTWHARYLHEVLRTNFSGAEEANPDGFVFCYAQQEF